MLSSDKNFQGVRPSPPARSTISKSQGIVSRGKILRRHRKRQPRLSTSCTRVGGSVSLQSNRQIANNGNRACYESLRTNAPTPLIEMSLNSWSPDTELYARHSVVVGYIREIAAKTGVDKAIHHNTKVDSVTKDRNTWRVHTSTRDATTGVLSEEWVGSKSSCCSQLGRAHPRADPTQVFDAVIVATGHYHAPYVPDIPGLAEWKLALPDRVQHSKGYRSNKGYEDQVLVVRIP